MTDAYDVAARNAEFAAHRFVEGLRINPSGNVMVIGCVDPRVDPAHVLGLRHGEAAVIRNVGGRVTPATLRSLAMLAKVGEANRDAGSSGDWSLVVLHHTDCGMTDLVPHADLLSEYFEITSEALLAKAVDDPVRSVQVDVEVIRAEIQGSAAFLVSGLVYDVATGLVEVIVPPTSLGPNSSSPLPE